MRSVVRAVLLVAAGGAGLFAWQQGAWGSLAGAALVTLLLTLSAGWREAGVASAAAPAQGDDAGNRLLLDAAPTPMIALHDGHGRALNRAARRLFATDDRIVALPPALADPQARDLRHEARHWRIERVTLSDARTIATLIDVEQEARLAEARATAEMIHVLGHELLNGLAPITSLADSALQAIETPGTDPALLHEIIGTLARRAEGLERFTTAYRTLARLPVPQPRATSPAGLAADWARLFAGRWPGVRLDLSVAADADWPLDRDQVTQGVLALLQNAAEAAAAGQQRPAWVALAVSIEAAGLTIEVADSGNGVAPDDAARIFRPFHTTKVDGTGVGLSLARQIAHAHGGTLALLPGLPTRFHLTLPPRDRIAMVDGGV
ncbi:histidine kinase [Sphingomonas sp. Leaf407]|nr:histidine kinase [Sphingomonas sp. Leaf42]KQT25451.1 histidine kinase [Sphingomonas sp. Leaf407]